jgi:hypothetical protein
MRLGRMLSVGEVVEQALVEEPATTQPASEQVADELAQEPAPDQAPARVDLSVSADR